MFLVLQLFLLFVGSLLFPKSPGYYERSHVVTFKFPSFSPSDIRSLDKELIEAGYEPFGYDLKNQQIKVLVNKAEFSLLESTGFQTVEVIDKTSMSVPEGYRPYEEIFEFLDRIHTEYPHLTTIIDVSKEYGPGTTYEGRPIKAMKLSSPGGEGEKLNILIDGVHHAREIVTAEVCIDLIEKLLLGYGNSPEITSWMDTYNIFVLPILNVDGYNYVFTQDPSWRKNRRPTTGGNFGVDLNRNYDVNWAEAGGSTDPASTTYRGESPFSEAETQTIRGMIKEFNFAKVVTFHSYGQEVLWYYSPKTYMPEDFREMIENYAKIVGTPAKYTTRGPSADAEHMEYEFVESTAYAWLVETSTTFQPEFETAKREISEQILPLLYHVINSTVLMTGKITNKETGNRIVAKIERLGYSWTQGENRRADKTGLYHLYLPLGHQRIKFSADGFEDQTIEVHIDGQAFVRDVQLEPFYPPK